MAQEGELPSIFVVGEDFPKLGIFALKQNTFCTLLKLAIQRNEMFLQVRQHYKQNKLDRHEHGYLNILMWNV